MLLSASIFLLGCSSAFADAHGNSMGCCEVKRVPGSMPKSGVYYLDTEYSGSLPDVCKNSCVYNAESGPARYCFSASSTYTAECQDSVEQGVENEITGVIISGGEGTETSIETFPAEANCTIPPFPQPGRKGHSLSVIKDGTELVACGGRDTLTDCISWRSGQDEWTHYATLSQERYQHAAVVLNKQVILVGGSGSNKFTGEIVRDGTAPFNLQNGGDGTCAVAYNQSEFVTIGGWVEWGQHGKVDRYDSEGKYLGSLPDLETPRNHHGCTSFLTDNGEKVFACCPIIFLLYFKQALLVAGGQNAGRSTEIFLPSRGRWVTTTTNLPR